MAFTWFSEHAKQSAQFAINLFTISILIGQSNKAISIKGYFKQENM